MSSLERPGGGGVEGGISVTDMVTILCCRLT